LIKSIEGDICFSMKQVLVQIYEIQEPGEAEAVAALGVDRIGTVILSGEDWKAPVLRDTVRAVQGAAVQSGLIPLFDDLQTVLRVLDYYRPDFVHFCEIISPFPMDRQMVIKQCDGLIGLQQAVKTRFPAVALMRSLSLPQPGMATDDGTLENILAILDKLAPVSDYFLIDTLRGMPGGAQEQPVTGFVGITGEICDWRIARGIVAQSPLPVILAGGLDDGNVEEAIRMVRPAGVDSCTRTNARTADGRPIRFRKDLEKVKRMVARVRRIEAEEICPR
jgi:phosphoribosylanthranilate isomerase